MGVQKTGGFDYIVVDSREIFYHSVEGGVTRGYRRDSGLDEHDSGCRWKIGGDQLVFLVDDEDRSVEQFQN